ncbi:FAD-binding domain-containing protein [Punctularia strigosozonata HHB-11173 SS5]|uniref:FAD-binding domain-containing protein n=1 Tax=Punctularia strigosozonata (strain HHB-11173) TaxID=741275 RepID=UPI000441762B|nr:FAD-binding domain-containing protein [Punctularia strigosozonata HHB-11173 SS5]EIN09895.1 FAD-binding domain-containing protein [Punctularia strigosozonata HHB-11173 SS5]
MARAFLLPALLAAFAGGLASAQNATDDNAAACADIASKISSASEVFYPNTTEYTADITLPASFFNRANATCVVEPGSDEDAAIVMTSLREHSNAVFGIMGGGHNLNAGFSSTTGVLVALRRFDEVTVIPAPGDNNQVALVNIGAGQTWDQVFAQTVPQGVNVVGGRFATVGVAGISLGGGYSWISNEHALAIDNVVSYTWISPKDSSINNVTAESNPDVFFALKGGLNNFGLVTKFQTRGYNQTNKVWAGTIYTQPGVSDEVAEALADFSENNTDVKAQVVGTFARGSNSSFEVLVLHYNAETPEPPAVFEKFLSFPRQNQSDFFLRTFDNFTSASLQTITFLNGERTRYSTLAVEGHPLSVVKAFQNQRDTLGPQLEALDPTFFGSWTVEPFIKSYWDTAVESATPHSSEHVLFPPNLEYTWNDPSLNDFMFESLANSTNALIQAALDAGQNVSTQIIYPNYAQPQTPVEQFYGQNLPRLQQIRATVDPENVMARAGGFKIQ